MGYSPDSEVQSGQKNGPAGAGPKYCWGGIQQQGRDSILALPLFPVVLMVTAKPEYVQSTSH
jgi:hypothetical protein